jgi:lipopolysaccharide export system protein LptC
LNLSKALIRFVCHQVADFWWAGEKKPLVENKNTGSYLPEKMSTLLLNERGDRGPVDSMKTRQEQSQTQSALIRPITHQVSIDKVFIRGYFWSNL